MTTAITPTVTCPLGCGRQVSAEGDDIHYCVTKTANGRKVETHREYVATWDGEALFYGDERGEVEADLQAYREEQLASGLMHTAAELDGGDVEAVTPLDPKEAPKQTWSDDPWDDGPSQEEQAASAAAWTPCDGGWEQYTPHPFDPSRTVRLFQPRLFGADQIPERPTPDDRHPTPEPPTVLPNPGLHLTCYTLVMSGPDEPFTSMTLTLCDSCAAGRRNLSKRGEVVNGYCDGCGAGPSVGHFRLAEPQPEPPVDDGPQDNWGGFYCSRRTIAPAPTFALTLPPIAVLAQVAAELATAAQEAGDTANMHALNKAVLQLHAGTVPVPTTGGFLIESRTRGGVVHRFSTAHGCSCEAGIKGKPCWHASLLEIIEAAQQRAVTAVPVAPVARVNWSEGPSYSVCN